MKNFIRLVRDVFRNNLKIIFAHKFIYFLVISFLVFVGVMLIMLFDSDSNPTETSVYYLLIFPGLLLIFYPTVFGIQNDVDARMIEIIFGIPNYRYKVYLVRLLLVYIVVFLILLFYSTLSYVSLTSFPVVNMALQLLFPVLFMGTLCFMFSTLVRNAYGTATIMVIIGLAFWISSDFLEESKWNIFLNPYHVPSDMNTMIWATITMNNRIYLFVGTILALLAGLFLLQKREKFV
ncbi:hypothetical protein JW935_12105 [candidate division KSB1 bacterium]|nr:hypothetical protein [candidate division KSB1 bacterium]